MLDTITCPVAAIHDWSTGSGCRNIRRPSIGGRRDSIDVLQNMRIDGLARQVAAMKEMIQVLMRMIDPEELKAARELKAITPSRSAFLAIAKNSGRPKSFCDDPEERPW